MNPVYKCHVLSLAYQEEFGPLLSPKRVAGTLSKVYSTSSPADSLSLSYWCVDSEKVLPKNYTRGILTQYQVDGLKHLYAELSRISPSEINVPSAFIKYKYLEINGKRIGAYQSRSSSSSLVITTKKVGSEERPARVHFFIKHSPTIQSVQYTFLLFYCSWHKPHRDKDIFGKPVTMTLWEVDVFDTDDCYSIIPIQNIKCRTVSLVDKISSTASTDLETVLLVCPSNNY